MTASQYWLAQWLDENEIHSEWEIDHTLHTQSGVRGLIEAVFKAAQEIQEGRAEYPSSNVLSDPIVAGRRLDLSSSASCPAYECMKRQIDTIFKQLWHYFDQVVVEGLAPLSLAREIGDTGAEPPPNAMMKIREQARLLLYLREIGAEQLVIFAPKPHAFCQQHWEQHARDLGLAEIIDESRQKNTIKEIVKSSKFDITETDRDGLPAWQITVVGEYFSVPWSRNAFSLHIAKRSNAPPTPEDVTRWMIGNRATEMISDVSLARRLASPLVEPISLPWISSQPHRDDSKRTAEDDAVVRIGLPVFDSLTTKDFLKLREDERPAFETFRAELRKAIQSEIAQDPSNPATAIAKSIQNKYLRPGLASIEQQVRSRRSALLKKTAVNLTIGTSAAAIGAITRMPLLVEGLVTSLGGTMPLTATIHKFIDDSEPIKMDKFYFLWQAEKQAGHH
jgi:hypothetical protein